MGKTLAAAVLAMTMIGGGLTACGSDDNHRDPRREPARDPPARQPVAAKVN